VLDTSTQVYVQVIEQKFGLLDVELIKILRYREFYERNFYISILVSGL